MTNQVPDIDAASVWDEAATVLYMGNAITPDHLKAMWERNPYRSATPKNGLVMREERLTLLATRGLTGKDAEGALDAYERTPAGGACGADAIRVDAILRDAAEASAPHALANDPRIDAIAAWCGRHRSGYYSEAQDDVMALIRSKP